MSTTLPLAASSAIQNHRVLSEEQSLKLENSSEEKDGEEEDIDDEERDGEDKDEGSEAIVLNQSQNPASLTLHLMWTPNTRGEAARATRSN